MIWCWAAFLAILGHIQTAGCALVRSTRKVHGELKTGMTCWLVPGTLPEITLLDCPMARPP